jgi:hypothetical protein
VVRVDDATMGIEVSVEMTDCPHNTQPLQLRDAIVELVFLQ